MTSYIWHEKSGGPKSISCARKVFFLFAIFILHSRESDRANINFWGILKTNLNLIKY